MADMSAINITTLDQAGLVGKPTARGRVVLLQFLASSACGKALRACKELRPKNIYLDSDLTVGQQSLCRMQGVHWQQLKDEGKSPFWREALLCFIEDDRPKRSVSLAQWRADDGQIHTL